MRQKAEEAVVKFLEARERGEVKEEVKEEVGKEVKEVKVLEVRDGRGRKRRIHRKVGGYRRRGWR